jgi:hypothetical protein
MVHKDFQDPADFWREYEEKIGEKVLAYGMGRLVSGWDEFTTLPLWGLLIASDGGFRFHHFPRQNWLLSILRAGAGGETEEKTIFIPRERILSAVLRTEKSVLKRLLFAVPPRLAIRYETPGGGEAELIAETGETGKKAEAIAGELSALTGRETGGSMKTEPGQSQPG